MPINVWDYLREYDELRDEIEIVCELYARPAVQAALKKFIESTDAQPYLP